MLTYLIGETHQGLIHATDDDVLLPPEQSHRLTVQLAQHLGSWPTTLQQAEGSVPGLRALSVDCGLLRTCM